ncbi:MAG: NHL repeat-containing protein [Terriglobales bacterium]
MQNSVVVGVQPGATSSPPSARSIADANTTMIVADSGAHRVLILRGPFLSAQSPAVVIGQPDLISTSPGRSAAQMRNPYDAILDAAGNLWAADTFNDRILEFVPPFRNGMSASLVLGEPDFTSDNFNLPGPKTSVGLAKPEGLAFDKAGNLWVADSYDNRVVEFTPPFQNGMAFTLEMKEVQQNGPGACGDVQETLCGPSNLTFDSAGNLWVVDSDNNRVLRLHNAKLSRTPRT